VSDFLPDYAAEIPQTPYAKVIVTHMNQDHINRLTQVFEEIGAKRWLEENPLSRLELTHFVVFQGKNVNGLYDFQEKVMQVATMRSPDEYHKVFDWQRIHSVSSTGDTQMESLKRTMIHELGHHIHNILMDMDVDLFGRTLRVNFLAGGTLYAQTSEYEYFAETFSLYVYFHDELLKRDAAGHGMIRLALSRIGLEVNPL
jgi:hypothetical protein